VEKVQRAVQQLVLYDNALDCNRSVLTVDGYFVQFEPEPGVRGTPTRYVGV